MMRIERIRRALLRRDRQETQLDVTYTIPLDPEEVEPALAERAEQLGCSLVWAELPDGRKLVAGLRQDGSIVDLVSGEVIDDGQPDITINLIEPNQQ